jgi:hypothetical protein
MTAPQPGNRLGDAFATFQELPKWAIAGIVIGGGLLAWWLIKAAGDDDFAGSKGISGLPADDAGGHPGGGGGSSQQYQSFLTSTPGNDATPPDPGTSYTDAADVTSYWYVPVAPAGWSSTFGGISQQFYGNTARAQELQTLNPNLQKTTYGKLPVGAMIKVPRT